MPVNLATDDRRAARASKGSRWTECRRWVRHGRLPALFLVAAAIAAAGVAGPGISWDEPAYRHSQVTLQNWLASMSRSRTWAEFARLWSADALAVHWEYNRFGHNMHPPMAGYANLLTFAAFGRWIDDYAARRLASAFLFAGVVTMAAAALGRRLGPVAATTGALSLLFMPRVMGDAHLVGTDSAILFFWSAAALAFWKGLSSPGWQWATCLLVACLVLVKFSGVMIAGPLVAALAATILWRRPSAPRGRTVVRALAALGPLAVVAVALLAHKPPPLPGTKGAPPIARQAGLVARLTDPVVDQSAVCFALLAGAATAAACFARADRRRWTALTPGDRALSFVWLLAAVTPLAAIAFNPSWWHQPGLKLADFLWLNLDREGKLPDIGIFYLGRRHYFSLPWHNAYVLMAVTIPLGTLGLGLAGLAEALRRGRGDAWWLFVVANMLALPIARMFKTPAHDGVRLFLPTFFFWSLLAGLGAWATVRLAVRLLAPRESSVRRRRGVAAIAWVALAAFGPAWSAYECARFHPCELSYYNLGLQRAVRLGFEPTYWYDAVTPKVVDAMNRVLVPAAAAANPPGAYALMLPDEKINPDVLPAWVGTGRLDPRVLPGRAGFLHQDGSREIYLATPASKGRPAALDDDWRPAWQALLTHSSKASAFTRLLYAVEPRLEHRVMGVRLFSLVDDRGTARAAALFKMLVLADNSFRLGAVLPDQDVLDAPLAELRLALRAVGALADRAAPAPGEDKAALPPLARARVDRLVERWGRRDWDRDAANIRKADPAVFEWAARTIVERKRDLLTILAFEGYLLEEDFNGMLK